MTCTTSSLATSAECYSCISPLGLKAMQVYALCNIINGVTMTCTPQALLSAATSAGFTRMSMMQLEVVMTYLLCNLAGGGGGLGEQEVFSGNYGGGVPTDTPTASSALGIDTSNGVVWQWYSNAWH